MSQKNETLPLILALVCTGAILTGGWWWFNNKSASEVTSTPPVANQNSNDTPNNNSPQTNNNTPVTFSFPNNVAQGTTINVNGSTSMVQINQAIKKGFERQFAGTAIATNGQGTGVGLKLLQEGKIDIAAISRPLTDAEKAQGLNAVPIARDAIAIVVGVNNPFRRGLSKNQVADIFQGKVTDWSNIGGKSNTIRVINRPSISGTRQVFQDEVLNGASFGTSANFTTLDRDATTPILRALSTDGISYATYAQVANQQTVRTVAVNGLTPEADNYPYYRVLYYTYQEPVTPEVEAFLGYVLSSQGQQAISSGG
ncbi:Phosphate ABC transporter substrate-binding protein, PhoT family [Hyella patelloides LEGE 07179]|uniref:Phosphate ABC transporter substrate-binding protein, PhoT family n=1 Tax=Hyella patelloides LEGE 07179 TaxID=945734 RepID=A0A563VRT3_9CYAN|nr:phosphate ABC transporter substrate-binding protein [Hyella patelloides]VEP14168.1 Phosphate ABC transporter substrate-binding protein, PhoT family [Hyella patelloides LEGE 07179]